MDIFAADGVEELSIGGDHGSGEEGQQEELWYRTSLQPTYPDKPDESNLGLHGVAYSAHVVIVRESFEKGHAWCDLSRPGHLQVVSVASVPHNTKPKLTATKPTRFTDKKDHEDCEQRWRDLLRLAGYLHHTRRVLGMPDYEHQDQALTSR